MAARSGVMIVLVLMAAVVASVSGYGTMVGGRTKVKDVDKNEEVQELGKFSVEEFNLRRSRRSGNGAPLVFSRVVEAERQVVSGIKYYLTIEASQNGLTRVFESVVVVKPWLHRRELLTFSPSTE